MEKNNICHFSTIDSIVIYEFINGSRNFDSLVINYGAWQHYICVAAEGVFRYPLLALFTRFQELSFGPTFLCSSDQPLRRYANELGLHGAPTFRDFNSFVRAMGM